ncbi:MAG: sulfurtransferase [Nesterenkonia sp.]|uniref:sulfurtransferase n=1 Tax=Nesterenkonia marinintestina TaxID=2979865 RepID=UPI0021BDFECC|nr:sulfurtransferase [Nesterenkonia sp. GX14115]MDO5492282.1 sulfurtransferase [Nesterenkonia sp.]
MTEKPSASRSADSGPLIDVDELERSLRDPDVPTPTLLDVRWSLGTPSDESYEQYLTAHVPGAVFVDLTTALSGPAREDGSGGRHPMPDAERFQAAMRRLGVSEDHPVVVYDAGPGLAAARAWWMLGHFGADDVRVLDGGLAAWQGAGSAVESGEHSPTPGDFTAEAGGRPSVTAQDIARRLSDSSSAEAAGTVLIDARPHERFIGRDESVDPVAGHIPGAVNLPALDLIDDGGGLLSGDEVVAAFSERGAHPSTPPTVSCGSGVQACHLALAWEAAHPEAPPAAVYIGSWSDWISAGDRPVARG